MLKSSCRLFEDFALTLAASQPDHNSHPAHLKYKNPKKLNLPGLRLSYSQIQISYFFFGGLTGRSSGNFTLLITVVAL